MEAGSADRDPPWSVFTGGDGREDNVEFFWRQDAGEDIARRMEGPRVKLQPPSFFSLSPLPVLDVEVDTRRASAVSPSERASEQV